MATSFGGMVSNFFGGASGGLEHKGGGSVTPLQANNPQQQLTTGNPDPNVTPSHDTKPTPDPLNSHLDQMAEVWKTATTADGKPITPQADPLAQPLFNFKNEDVIASAKKLDFTSQVNPELLTKAVGGDVDAMRQALNETVQTAFAAMTLQSGKLMNDGFQRHGQAFDAALPTRLRNHEVATRQSDDPVLSHPSVAPVVKAMMATIAAQQPQLRPDQVQSAAENYVKNLGGAFTIQQQATTVKKQQEESPNWLDWANLEQGK